MILGMVPGKDAAKPVLPREHWEDKAVAEFHSYAYKLLEKYSVFHSIYIL